MAADPFRLQTGLEMNAQFALINPGAAHRRIHPSGAVRIALVVLMLAGAGCGPSLATDPRLRTALRLQLINTTDIELPLILDWAERRDDGGLLALRLFGPANVAPGNDVVLRTPESSRSNIDEARYEFVVGVLRLETDQDPFFVQEFDPVDPLTVNALGIYVQFDEKTNAFMAVKEAIELRNW